MNRFSGCVQKLLACGLPFVLISCGGSDGNGSPTPPVETGQTVLVQVTTTGQDIDPDGYDVRLGSRSAAVPPTGTATFDDVSAGTYQVSLEGVAANCTIQGVATASVSVTSSSGAQASFTVECEVDFEDGLETVACTDLSLAASSGVPLDRIAAGSVPGTLDPPLAAWVRTSDGTSMGYAWFEATEGGELEFVTPLHPSGELQGGEVLIRVSDGNVSCEPFEFTIEPLPASPGELSTVVDRLQDVLRAQAAVLETTPEDLVATPIADVGEVLLPMAIVQFMLDHPENERSLRRIAEGTSSLDVPLDRIEALLARIDLGDGAANPIVSGPAAHRASSTMAAEDCMPDEIGQDTQRLSDCMNARRDLDAVFPALVDSVAPLLTVAVASGAAGAPDLVLSNALVWTAVQQNLRITAALPRDLRWNVLTADPERFMEDDPDTGEWTANVTAVNLGWDLATTELMLSFWNSTAGGLIGLGFELTDVEDDLNGIGAQILEELGDDATIPQRSFGPVSVDDEQWSDVAYVGSDPAVEKVEHNSYKAVSVGTANLSIQVPPEEGELKFGGSGAGTLERLDVDSIIIRVEPEDTVLEPDDMATFRVTVENSRFPEQITANAVQGTVQLPMEPTGDNTFNLHYTAPSNPDFDSSDRVVVLHEAETGARMNGPERRGEAEVRFGRVRIVSSPICVSLAITLDPNFTAEVKGFDDESVTWTVDHGTIDQDGQYESPSERPTSGMATVRATSNAYPDLFDEVTFALGCTCNYGLNVGGEMVMAQPGDRISFSTSDGQLTSVLVMKPSESWAASVLPLGDIATWPDGPGTWPVRIQGDMGLVDPLDAIWASDDEMAPVLHLDRFEPSVRLIRGWIENATVDVANPESPRKTLVDFWFAARYEPGESPCTVPGPEGG